MLAVIRLYSAPFEFAMALRILAIRLSNVGKKRPVLHKNISKSPPPIFAQSKHLKTIVGRV
jgi:hypothetical protein